MNLVEISNKVKTTKKGLGYFEIYEKYFKKLRLKKLNILEIGVHLMGHKKEEVISEIIKESKK